MTEISGIGKTLEEKIQALDETGDIPTAKQLRDKFPTGLISVMHLPGFGPKRARRLYDELGIDSLDALRAAAEQQKIRGLRGFGAKVEETLLKTLAESPEGGPAPRILLSRAQNIAEQIVGALRSHPAAERVEVAGSLRRQADSVKDLDIIATAAGSRRAVGRAGRAAAGRVRAVGGRRRRARAHALGHEGRPQGRRARPVRQRAAALHRLQGAQRGAARVGGAARAARLGVRDPRRRDGRDAALRDRGGGLRAPRPRVDPARAARGPRRARGGAAPGARGCRSW